uniref:Glutaredoxin n=1 Tax=Timspurckia oligopyrenoides TaxID=708627 RepID=A0A7S0ZCK5_9RHOD|mmetsp:Transcript_12507/g.22577  ORF Transcript_12507/g.22577 Transcript_12507/m.22577 type:complete len:320 (+) Transcript_12507:62-1021(+)
MEDITEYSNLEQIVINDKRPLVIVFHKADIPQCAQILELVSALESKLKSTAALSFAKVEFDAAKQLCLRFKVKELPTTLIIDETLNELSRIIGADSVQAAKSIQEIAEQSSERIQKRMLALIESAHVMLFMKGDSDAPKCKFSKQIIQILQEQKIDFQQYNILSDRAIRERLKVYANWPTFPQLYCKGEFIGGVDVVQELAENGTLRSELYGNEAMDLNSRLEALINENPIQLFMKGDRNYPQCGFSARIVSILDSEGIEYGTFDILSDPKVRQGLKEHSKWPTYPQLYANGELIGGLDVIAELSQLGQLHNELGIDPK